MAVTFERDNACLRGVLKSILKDAFDDGPKATKILEEIERTTTGTFTPLNGLIVLLQKSFSSVEETPLGPGDNFSVLHGKAPDNTNSFGILLWNGDENNQHCHATRVTEVVSDDTLQLFGTTDSDEPIGERSREELLGKSTKGFNYIRLEK
jgi:hypothetical protein